MMKNKLTATFIFLFCFQFLFSQDKKIDTIYCNTFTTTYMVFPSNIDLFDIGNPDEFVGKIEGGSIFVKATKPTNQISTYLVKTGDSYYYGVLIFKKDNKSFYYDFRTVVKNDNVVKANVPVQKTKEQNQVSLNDQLVEFLKLKNEVQTIGLMSEYLDVAVPLIRNDNDKTFIKILIKNKSSIPYKLDFISFQYFQDERKGFGKKKRKAPTDVFPVAQPEQKEVSAQSVSELGYVIPIFALANNGYLIVTFREMNGDRVLPLKITGSFIQSCKKLQQ